MCHRVHGSWALSTHPQTPRQTFTIIFFTQHSGFAANINILKSWKKGKVESDETNSEENPIYNFYISLSLSLWVFGAIYTTNITFPTFSLAERKSRRSFSRLHSIQMKATAVVEIVTQFACISIMEDSGTQPSKSDCSFG